MKEYLYNLLVPAIKKQLDDAINKSVPSFEPKQKGTAKYNPNNRKGRCRQ